VRKAEINRITKETKINISLNVDGTGKNNIDTGVGFLDHMLILFAKHGLFDLDIKCDGDLYIDAHHTVEDIGIALGAAFKQALGDKKGIKRYGDIYLPMDETLCLVAVDLGGRNYLHFEANFPSPFLGTMSSELIKEFFFGFSRECGINLHIKIIHGENSHHMSEAMFKGFARAMDFATSIDSRIVNEIPSTKGVI
jgi:imidazoleglycerol-phosphate dehydratase